MKKLLISLMALGLICGGAGCTSGSSPDAQPSDTQEMAGDTNAEISDMAADSMADEAAGDDFGDFGDFGDEAVADGTDAAADADIQEPASDMAATDTSLSDDLAADSQGMDGMDDMAATDGAAPADEMAGIGPDDSMAPADSGSDMGMDSAMGSDMAMGSDTGSADLGTSDTSMDSSYAYESSDSSAESAGPSEGFGRPSLNKMLTTPYRKAGVLVNAIYIVRPGDTMDSISNKIYGMDKVAELKSVNTHLASRDLVVGDKVYYNSPRRPADEATLLTYYEDAGLTPETYVSQPGDNIRAVGKTLLGDSKSWKELWATNLDVESKDILPEGTRLRYWSSDLGGAVPAAPPVTTAQVDDVPPAPPEDVPPMPEQPEAADQSLAMNQPDQAAQDQMAQDQMAPPPVEAAPPPPAIVEAPPPPPPVELPAPAVKADDGATVSGDDTTALIAGAVLLLVAVIMVIVIRKRKAKKSIDFQTATHTQLE